MKPLSWAGPYSIVRRMFRPDLLWRIQRRRMNGPIRSSRSATVYEWACCVDLRSRTSQIPPKSQRVASFLS